MTTDVAKTPEAVDVPVADLQTFGFSLARKLIQPGQNFIFSPLSIAIALGMAAGGAQGETQKQILDAMGYSDAKDLGILSQLLADIQKLNPMLSVANLLVVSDKYGLKPVFQKFTEGMFEARVDLKPFAEQATVDHINGWVKDSTGGMIKQLVDKLDPLDIMVILNAIYFDGKWTSEFTPAIERPFYTKKVNHGLPTLSIPGKVNVPTLSKTIKHVMYGETNGTQIIALPYKDSSIGMFVCLPDDLNAFVSSLTSAHWQTLVKAMHNTPEVSFQMPKWTQEMTLDDNLKAALVSLGITTAFDADKADFTSMTDAGELFISQIIQKAKIQVDEKGTQAAAATGIHMIVGAMPKQEEPVRMIVDRPFFYALVDFATRTTLFMGAVTSPKV